MIFGHEPRYFYKPTNEEPPTYLSITESDTYHCFHAWIRKDRMNRAERKLFEHDLEMLVKRYLNAPQTEEAMKKWLATTNQD